MPRAQLFVLALSVVLVPQAWSDDLTRGSADGKHEIAVQLGAFDPTARFGINGLTGDKGERFGSTGFMFSVDYYRKLTPALSAGVEGLFMNRGTYELKNLVANPGAHTLVRGDTRAVLATLRIKKSGSGIRPYAIAGFGGHITNMDAYLLAPPGTIWAGFGKELSIVKGQNTGVIWTLRAGVERAFAEGGVIGLELGYVGIPAQTYLRTASGRAFGLPNDVVTSGDGLSLTAKFAYRFNTGS